MDTFLLMAETLSVRLHSGAVGALLGVLVFPAGRDIGACKQMFCSWILAVFGTPIAIAIGRATPLSSSVVAEMQSTELESASAFLLGMLGWRVLGWVKRRVDQIEGAN